MGRQTGQAVSATGKHPGLSLCWHDLRHHQDQLCYQGTIHTARTTCSRQALQQCIANLYCVLAQQLMGSHRHGQVQLRPGTRWQHSGVRESCERDRTHKRLRQCICKQHDTMAQYLHPTSQARTAIVLLALQAPAAAEHFSRDSRDSLHSRPHLQQPECFLQAQSSSCHHCSWHIPRWLDCGARRLWLPADTLCWPQCVLSQPGDRLANEQRLPTDSGHRGYTVPHT